MLDQASCKVPSLRLAKHYIWYVWYAVTIETLIGSQMAWKDIPSRAYTTVYPFRCCLKRAMKANEAESAILDKSGIQDTPSEPFRTMAA